MNLVSTKKTNINKLKKTFKIVLCLLTINAFSQQKLNDTQTKISQNLENYFKLTRENIHLHLNKSTYFTNEDIVYKGYVVNSKTTLPLGETTNVYVNLLNSEGIILKNNLNFAENSVFTGYFELNDLPQTGIY